MLDKFQQRLLVHLNSTGCVLNPLGGDRYVMITCNSDKHFHCRVMYSENDDDFEVIKAKTPEEAFEAHVCTQCHVLNGDGSCCGCLEIQRDQGRYEELWGKDD